MKLESYQIPESYQSYLEQFENEPDAAISRLEKHVAKRKKGAVGYFFLSWLYQKNDQPQKAVQSAVQARILAPGSKYFEKLPYFLSHPKQFEAWAPDDEHLSFYAETDSKTIESTHPIHDLDSLISKLSAVERKRIKPDFSESDQDKDLGVESEKVDDIVTETLAVIHEKQKNYSDAIETYKKLIRTNPHKEEHFQKQIRRLKKKLDAESSDSE